jgi:prepilin-type N-terminal cleavage/methylation domain-containing protein
MFARIRAARENESGFTLVELLIVIVILGILAGIVVFSVAGITGRGAAAACKSDVASVQVATEAYYAQTGGWPADIPALVTAKLLKSAPTTAGIAVSATTGAVTVSPACPAS